jgi:hypothetical protein
MLDGGPMKIIVQLLLIVLIFQDFLANNIAAFSYIDEGLAVLLPAYCIYLLGVKKVKIQLTLLEKAALGLFAAFVAITFISSLVNSSLPFVLGVISMGMTTKGYIIYFSSRIIFSYHKCSMDIFKNTSKLLEYSIYVLAIIALVNVRFRLFQYSYGIRFGIRSSALFFSHPTELSFFIIISYLLIIFYSSWKNEKVNLLLLTSASTIVLLIAGRSKALGFAALCIGLLILIKSFKKIKLAYLIPLIPVSLYIVAPRIRSELLRPQAARGTLYSTAVKIANDFFPLGSGFGTFGSEISRRYYSELYDIYAISHVRGLSRAMPRFITDTYWAMIIAEGGWISTVFILAVLTAIFIQALRAKLNYLSRFAVMGIITYTLMSSIAEPIYSSYKSAGIFIIISLIVSISDITLKKPADMQCEAVS